MSSSTSESAKIALKMSKDGFSTRCSSSSSSSSLTPTWLPGLATPKPSEVPSPIRIELSGSRNCRSRSIRSFSIVRSLSISLSSSACFLSSSTCPCESTWYGFGTPKRLQRSRSGRHSDTERIGTPNIPPLPASVASYRFMSNVTFLFYLKKAHDWLLRLCMDLTPLLGFITTKLLIVYNIGLCSRSKTGCHEII